MPEQINDERIGESFDYLFKIIDQMNQSGTDDDGVIWDFSQTKTLNPFFLLPLSLYRLTCNKSIVYSNIPNELARYFNMIWFDRFLEAETVKDFATFMARYKERSYIPMIKFPANASKDAIKNGILGVIGDIIRVQLSIKGDLYIAMRYMLSELIDNITEHSGSEYGYIFAQYYPCKKYIDICIADTGITLLGSYRKTNSLGIDNDIEAMRQATQGISTKNLPDAENRGYGIVTSKNMLAEGLKGQFLMFSGGAFYRKTENEEVVYELPNTIKWNGTIALLRIPYSYNSNFNYINYMED
ncbi:MAG: hypothetical protein LBN06_02895 [Prevotellaceae bacterium]|jgi:anti-sigma regulatory factor (Ser/Thr protein kinase)|nr:hypothetical protein [Prevotellaceae bacterium]